MRGRAPALVAEPPCAFSAQRFRVRKGARGVMQNCNIHLAFTSWPPRGYATAAMLCCAARVANGSVAPSVHCSCLTGSRRSYVVGMLQAAVVCSSCQKMTPPSPGTPSDQPGPRRRYARCSCHGRLTCPPIAELPSQQNPTQVFLVASQHSPLLRSHPPACLCCRSPPVSAALECAAQL